MSNRAHHQNTTFNRILLHSFLFAGAFFAESANAAPWHDLAPKPVMRNAFSSTLTEASTVLPPNTLLSLTGERGRGRRLDAMTDEGLFLFTYNATFQSPGEVKGYGYTCDASRTGCDNTFSCSSGGTASTNCVARTLSWFDYRNVTTTPSLISVPDISVSLTTPKNLIAMGYFRPNVTGTWTFFAQTSGAMDVWLADASWQGGWDGTYGDHTRDNELLASDSYRASPASGKFSSAVPSFDLIEGLDYPLLILMATCCGVNYTHRLMFQGPGFFGRTSGNDAGTAPGTTFFYNSPTAVRTYLAQAAPPIQGCLKDVRMLGFRWSVPPPVMDFAGLTQAQCINECQNLPICEFYRWSTNGNCALRWIPQLPGGFVNAGESVCVFKGNYFDSASKQAYYCLQQQQQPRGIYLPPSAAPLGPTTQATCTKACSAQATCEFSFQNTTGHCTLMNSLFTTANSGTGQDGTVCMKAAYMTSASDNVACEGDSFLVSCPRQEAGNAASQLFITSITYAFWGRSTSNVCSGDPTLTSNTACSANSNFLIGNITSRCVNPGKNGTWLSSCSINATSLAVSYAGC